MIKKYNQFVYENISAAKDFLLKRELAKLPKKPKKTADKPMAVSPDGDIVPNKEEKKDSNKVKDSINLNDYTAEEKTAAMAAIKADTKFKQIVEMLKKHQSYIYAFVKFYYTEEVSIEDLQVLFNKMEQYKLFLNQLPWQIDAYGSYEKKDANDRSGFERLSDDIDIIATNRSIRKFVNQLPANFKKEYEVSSQQIKDRIAGLAVAFDELGTKKGVKDEAKNKLLQKDFFIGARRYDPQDNTNSPYYGMPVKKRFKEFLDAASGYIEAMSIEGYSDFMEEVAEVNDKYENLFGVDITYDSNKILVLYVKSFVAMKALFGNTKWCIKDTLGYWEQYNGTDDRETFNKQYAIVNFNLNPSDTKYMIGVTIEYNGSEYGRVRAAHDKLDYDFISEYESYLKEWKIPKSALAPMTTEEVELKKKRIKANKEIQDKNLTIEKTDALLKDGANINISNGKPILNAIENNNVDLVKYMVKNHAMLNIPIKNNSEVLFPIDYADTPEMIKTLIDLGSEFTENTIQKKVAYNKELIEYAHSKGVDLTVSDSLILRCTALTGDLEFFKKLVEEYKLAIDGKDYHVLKWALSARQINIFDYAFNYIIEHKDSLREQRDETINDDNTLNSERAEEYVDDIVYHPIIETSYEKLSNQKISKATVIKRMIKYCRPDEQEGVMKYAESVTNMRQEKGHADAGDDIKDEE